MKDKIKETFNNLAGAYEHSIDTQNLYNSEYERPAMLAQRKGEVGWTKN